MMKVIAGIDEAGRGPLAGPVIAAAVILNPEHPIPGLMDSKVLSEKKREQLYASIIQHALSYGIGRAEPHEIDEINIFQATFLAMQRAFDHLSIMPDLAQIDGKFSPELPCESEAIIKGDSLIPAISAASILAKVTRDREMCAFDAKYPEYGFKKHKGYPTKAHRLAVLIHGPSPIHRLSFKCKA